MSTPITEPASTLATGLPASEQMPPVTPPKGNASTQPEEEATPSVKEELADWKAKARLWEARAKRVSPTRAQG